MQKLHPVGFTAELDGLILSARKGAKTGRFVVPLDGKLLKLLADAEARGRSAAPRHQEEPASPRLVRPESALTPREMQDRIRAGWTLEEVAAEAGVDHDWVRRFASPVFAELRRVIERARASVYDKPRFGLSALPLGASVRRNVFDRGVRLLDEELDDCWSAFQLDDDVWVVRFVYASRGRAQEAEWVYDAETEELSSRNRLAAQLGHVARGRAKRPPAAPTMPKPSASTKAAAKAAKATTKTSATPARRVPAPPARRPAATSANGAAARSRTAKKATKKKAAARPAKKAAKKTAKAKAKAHPVTVAVEPVPVAPAAVLPPPTLPPSPPSPPRPEPDPVVEPEHVVVSLVDPDQPPQPGPVDVDVTAGVAHIDSRRSWHGAVGRPRRTEPLRGR